MLCGCRGCFYLSNPKYSKFHFPALAEVFLRQIGRETVEVIIQVDLI